MSAITAVRIVLLPALLLAAMGSQAETSSVIFSSGFEPGVVPPQGTVEPTFANETLQRLDRMTSTSMPYAFDALWTDFNNDGCYDAFLYNHGDAALSRVWVNRCDGSNTFVYHGNDDVNFAIPEPDSFNGAGWLTLLDPNGDGRQDYWSWYAASQAAWFVNGTADGAQVPWFSEKRLACNDHCAFADINGDHELDIIHPDAGVEGILSRSTISAPQSTWAEVIIADADGDGWSDILQPELGGYWHNAQGQLEWRDTGLHGRPDLYAVADFDNDGDMDVFTFTNGPALLFRNDGNGQYVDVTSGSGLEGYSSISWWTGYSNSVAADVNNDGLQDLVIAGAGYAPSVTVLRNTGDLHFVETAVDLGEAGDGSYKSRAALADFDNDGRLDIIKTQATTQVGIWRNTTATGGAHWMKVRVRGEGLNSDGVGADIKWYRPGTSTLVAHMAVHVSEEHPQTWLHTGVGAAATVDMVIRYPNGGPTYHFDNLPSDQEVIVFPNGCLIQDWQPGNGWPLTAPAGCGN